MTRFLIPLLLLALPACSGAPPSETPPGDEADAGLVARGSALPPPDFEEVPPSETGRPADTWAGRWTGPEGLTLDIATRDDGDYDLAMRWTLDDEGRFVGRGEGDAILFERAGTSRRLRPATGDETGMKWLAGKRDCLVVEVGSEAYCRD